MTENTDYYFRYFADPRHFSTYVTIPRKCDICGQARPGYADSFYTSDAGPDIRFVCEEDLHAGRLETVGAQVNNGDRFELTEQAGKAHPDWTQELADAYTAERNRELEICTPSITTWSDYAWPVHCADYMRYIKEIGQADCARLDASGNGRVFLEQALEPSYKEEDDPQQLAEYLDDLWSRMRRDSPPDNSAVTPASFYLFQCIQCKDYMIEWDADEITATVPADAYTVDGE